MSQEELDGDHAHLACQINNTSKILPTGSPASFSLHPAIELVASNPSDQQESDMSKRYQQLQNLLLRLVPTKSAENC